MIKKLIILLRKLTEKKNYILTPEMVERSEVDPMIGLENVKP